MANGKGDIVY